MEAGVPSDLSVELTRRDAGWLIARVFTVAAGAQFFTEWLSAAQTEKMHNHNASSIAPPEPDRWNSYQPKFFSPKQFQILDEFTAILIPSDDTPGAREAHVAPFIDFVVNAAAEYAPDVQQNWKSAIEWLEASGFAALSPDKQLQLVKDAGAPEFDKKKTHAGFKSYRLIKDMTVRAFYTSRAGLIDVLEYKGLAYLTQFPGCTHPEHQKV
jgi:hypothetical protein